MYWWYTYPSEKYNFVTWDDDIPNWMESHKIPWFQTNQIYYASTHIKACFKTPILRAWPWACQQMFFPSHWRSPQPAPLAFKLSFNGNPGW